MNEEITRIYGNRTRVRVCGLCYLDNKLLMVNHSAMANRDFWAPPGGGVEFGQSLSEALIREFREETGLIVEVGKFRFGCEFIQAPLHAVELFFEVTRLSGDLKTGSDPELQIISEVRLMSNEEINSLSYDNLHGVFRICQKAEKLQDLAGFIRI